MADEWDKYIVENKEDEWEQYATQPTAEQPQKPKLNILGELFTRPSAAIRSGLMGKGYAKGATNPTEVPTFQETALNKYWDALPTEQANPATIALHAISGIPVSAMGMAADMATNPMDMLLTLVGAKGGVQVGKAVTKTGQALSKVFKYDNALKQAQKADVALDGIRDTFGKAVQVAIDQIKDVPTNLNWGKATPKIAETIKNPIYEIEFEQMGNVKQTVGNLQKVKKAIGDLMGSPKFWEEAGNTEKQLTKKFYGDLASEMKSVAKSAGKPIDEVMDNYSKFMQNYHLIKPKLTDTAGNAMANKLISTFRWTAEPAVKEAWKDVAKGSKEVKGIVNSRGNRELLKGLLKGAGVGIPTVEAGKRLITGRW